MHIPVGLDMSSLGYKTFGLFPYCITKMMLIERVLPEVIGGLACLKDRLIAEEVAQGLKVDEVESWISLVPATLLSSGCFLDRLTGL
jgi:hypothetical protein